MNRLRCGKLLPQKKHTQLSTGGSAVEQRCGSCTAGYCHTELLMLDSESALRGNREHGLDSFH
jgi:hypothetical protein